MYRKWECASPRAVFLLVHGLGAHSGRWDFFGQYFAARGFASYALELKGFGRTPDLPRGHVDSFEIYYRDVASLKDVAKKEYPGVPVYLAGESMGGLIAYIMATRRAGFCDGLICMSPAFRSRLLFPLIAYLDIFASYYVNPRKQYRMPFNSAMCTRDPAYRQVMDDNAAENRLASARMLGTIFLAQQAAGIAPGSFGGPALFLLAGDDSMVSPHASEHLFSRFRSADKTIIRYPEMFHALSVDLGREKVFGDILQWVSARS